MRPPPPLVLGARATRSLARSCGQPTCACGVGVCISVCTPEPPPSPLRSTCPRFPPLRNPPTQLAAALAVPPDAAAAAAATPPLPPPGRPGAGQACGWPSVSFEGRALMSFDLPPRFEVKRAHAGPPVAPIEMAAGSRSHRHTARRRGPDELPHSATRSSQKRSSS